MQKLGTILFLLGIACFALPLLGIGLSWFAYLGAYRMLTAILLVMMGVCLFLFSNYN